MFRHGIARLSAVIVVLAAVISTKPAQAQVTPYYQPIADIATLQGLSSADVSNYPYVEVGAYRSGGTTGGGRFDWYSTCPWTPDTGTAIQPTSVMSGCYVRENISGGLDGYMFGAYGDNSHDDADAINAAGTAVCTNSALPQKRLNILPARSTAYMIMHPVHMPCDGFAIFASGLGSLLRMNADLDGVDQTTGSILDSASIHDLFVTVQTSSSTHIGFDLPNTRALHLYNIDTGDFNIANRFLIGLDLSVTINAGASYSALVSGCHLRTRPNASAIGIRALGYNASYFPTTAHIEGCNIAAGLGDCFYLQTSGYSIDGNVCESDSTANGVVIDSATIGSGTGTVNSITHNDFESLSGYAILADSTSNMNSSEDNGISGALISDASHKNNFNDCYPGPIPSLALNSAAPSVSGCQTFYTHATSATSITTLPDLEYQWGNMPPYTIICNDTNTTFVNSSTFKLRNGMNYTCGAVGDVIRFTRLSGSVEVQVDTQN